MKTFSPQAVLKTVCALIKTKNVCLTFRELHDGSPALPAHLEAWAPLTCDRLKPEDLLSITMERWALTHMRVALEEGSKQGNVGEGTS